MDESILVSILMPVYNGSEYIEEAIESLIKQTYRNLEIIVVDNASTDDSVEKVERFDDDRIHVYVNDENKGQLYSLQRGVSLAHGKYVARLDCDDVSTPERIETQLKYMEAHPEVMLCGCNTYEIIDREVQKVKNIENNKEENVKIKSLYYDSVAHSSFFFRREELEKAGIGYEKYKYAQDYHMIFDILERSEVVRLPQYMVGYRMHEGQTTYSFSDSVKEKEEDEIVSTYMEHTGFTKEDTELMIKARRHRMEEYSDYQDFFNLVRKHLQLIGVSTEDEDAKKSISDAIWTIITMQKVRNGKLLKAYCNSGFANRDYLKKNWMWAVCCILGINTIRR